MSIVYFRQRRDRLLCLQEQTISFFKDLIFMHNHGNKMRCTEIFIHFSGNMNIHYFHHFICINAHGVPNISNFSLILFFVIHAQIVLYRNFKSLKLLMSPARNMYINFWQLDEWTNYVNSYSKWVYSHNFINTFQTEN